MSQKSPKHARFWRFSRTFDKSCTILEKVGILTKKTASPGCTLVGFPLRIQQKGSKNLTFLKTCKFVYIVRVQVCGRCVCAHMIVHRRICVCVCRHATHIHTCRILIWNFARDFFGVSFLGRFFDRFFWGAFLALQKSIRNFRFKFEISEKP